MRSISSLWRKLREKAYREEFVASQVRMAIPFQIRALMRKKKISQQQLAERSGLTQGVISRAANPAYGKMTLNTVIRVAAGLDVAFVGVFVPFSKLVNFYDKINERELSEVATFSEEDQTLGGDLPDDVDSLREQFRRASDAAQARFNKLQSENQLQAINGASEPQPLDFMKAELEEVRKRKSLPLPLGDDGRREQLPPAA